MRISQQMLHNKFELFVENIGLKIGRNIGDLRLNNDGYGFCIYQAVNKGGGVSCPFGHACHSTREMYEMLSFAIDTLWIKENNHESTTNI